MDRTLYTTNFKRDFNFEPPDTAVLNLRDRLGRITVPNISDYLIECFPEYLHNRVGTLLMKSERELLNPNIMPDFDNLKGRLIVYQERYEEYKWAILVGNSDGKKKDIYINDRGTYRKITVFNHSLVYYPLGEDILQTGERSYRLTKESLIETYNLN